MSKRTLHLDIQADDTFINRVHTEIKRRWSAMSPSERAVTTVLIEALNKDRQAGTKDLCAALKERVSLETVIHSLRTKHAIPIVVAVGRSGGYRLPISRADCTLFLQSEVSGLFRKVERLLSVNKAMVAFNVRDEASKSSLDALETLYKVHQLKAR
jgi:hypothetical protein